MDHSTKNIAEFASRLDFAGIVSPMCPVRSHLCLRPISGDGFHPDIEKSPHRGGVRPFFPRFSAPSVHRSVQGDQPVTCCLSAEKSTVRKMVEALPFSFAR
jgi:hypothetical protein